MPISIKRASVFRDGLDHPEGIAVHPDGSIWAGRIAGIGADSLRLQLSSGALLDLPIGQISEIAFHSHRVVFLSSLTPAGYDHEPFGATRWP